MTRLALIGFVVILVGFGLIFAGSVGDGGTSTGAVVFIGPFPIVFGSGPAGGSLALISLAIGAAMVVLFVIWGWIASRRDWEVLARALRNRVESTSAFELDRLC